MAPSRPLPAVLSSLVILAAVPAAAQVLPQEVDWKGAPPGFLYFRHQLLPLLKQQCGSTSCHGGFTAGRLHLAPPLETGEYSNQAAMANYRSALSLVNPAVRETSPLLLKPLRLDSFDFVREVKAITPPKDNHPRRVTYKGGANTDPSSREMFNALLDWVKGRRVTNYAPIAFAGRNRTVAIKSQVVLDGSLSFDPNPEDQKRLKYEWTLLTQPAGSSAKLKASTKPNPQVTPDKPGTYVIRLRVTDPKRRESDPSYVVLTARGEQEEADLKAFAERTTEKHEIDVATAKISGAGKLVDAVDDAGRKALNVDPKGKAPGEIAADFTVTRPGKYGLWLVVRDTVKEEDAPRGPVDVAVDGRKLAVLPVPADNEYWRIVRFGSTTALRASGDGGAGTTVGGPSVGIWKKTSGTFEEDAEKKTLVASGQGFTGGRNVAEVGVDLEGEMIISVTIKPTDEYKFTNGFIVFDYKSPTDYKIAGLEISGARNGKKFVIDSVGSKGAVPLYAEADLEPNKEYSVRLEIVDDTATLYYEGRKLLTQKYPKPLSGRVGLASLSSKTSFDNLFIWRNKQLVYSNGFGDDPALPEDAGAGDDPTARLKRQKLPGFRLTAGRHNIKIGAYPGAPDIQKIVVARIDTLADVPMAARKTVRGIYMDVLGRAPTEEELSRDAAKAPAQLVKELTASYEFWNWFYEEELFHLELTDTYRPIDLDFDYITLPSAMHNGKATILDSYEQLLKGLYFLAKNYGEEEYPRALWMYLYDKDLLDEPDLFDASKAMMRFEEEQENAPVDKKTKKKAAPKVPSVFGKPGKNHADLAKICLEQPAFAESMAARLRKRYTGIDPTAAEAKKDAAALLAGWKSGKEALAGLVTEWCSSPAYLARVNSHRRKSDAVFVRTLYVDMFNRVPEFGEFWGCYRIIRSVSDSEPMRNIVAGMMADAEEADLPNKNEIVRSEWIKEQIVKFLGREPKAGEVARLDGIFARPECTARLVIRALVTHPEYQMY